MPTPSNHVRRAVCRAIATMPQTILKIENLNLFIPGDMRREIIFHDLNLDVERGRHIALLGANGSGKSTLLRLIHGDLWPASGKISWLCASGWETSPIMAKTVTALVSPHLQEQIQRQAHDVSVGDFLQGGLAGSPFSYSFGGNMAAAIPELARKLGIADLLTARLPALSQGQARMALIARALLAKPRILLLDECADGLDAAHREKLFTHLKNVASGATIIFTSHRRDCAPDWIKLKLYLENGRLSGRKPAAKHFSGEVCEASIAKQPIADEYLIRLQNVSVYINHALILKNITWAMRKGENWRITGENGSGKSTFLRLLAGDEDAAAGGAILRWPQGETLSLLEETRRRIRLVSDLGQALYGYPLTALELVCTGFDNTIGLWREISPEERRAALEMIRFFFPENDNIAGTSIRRLSSGQLRRLYLARAMMGKPDILLLDEPCGGLDEDSRNAWLRTLDRVASGKSAMPAPGIVFISHFDADAPTCLNREARMDGGRLMIIR